MPGLLVGAEPREFSGLVKFCRNVKAAAWPVNWARSAEIEGRQVWLVANGAGARRAALAVNAASVVTKLDWVCSMGYCGALEDSMAAGEIFVAERVESPWGSYPARRLESDRRYKTGVLVSIDHVARTREEKRQLRERGASAVEMEAGGVARTAAELSLPFYCVRSVTDLAGESFDFDFNEALRSDGRFDTMRLIAATCRRPLSLLPEFVRLWRRSRAASQTLGEFIASCRF